MLTIAEPLYKLLRGHKIQFIWTVPYQQAFDNLSSKIITSLIFGYSDFATPFVLFIYNFRHNNWYCA